MPISENPPSTIQTLSIPFHRRFKRHSPFTSSTSRFQYVRTQSARAETIEGLFKPVSYDKDDGIIRELLDDFYFGRNTTQLKPKNIYSVFTTAQQLIVVGSRSL